MNEHEKVFILLEELKEVLRQPISLYLKNEEEIQNFKDMGVETVLDAVKLSHRLVKAREEENIFRVNINVRKVTNEENSILSTSLSNRAKNALLRNRIRTCEEAKRMTKKELLKITRICEKVSQEVYDFFHK